MGGKRGRDSLYGWGVVGGLYYEDVFDYLDRFEFFCLIEIIFVCENFFMVKGVRLRF